MHTRTNAHKCTNTQTSKKYAHASTRKYQYKSHLQTLHFVTWKQILHRQKNKQIQSNAHMYKHEHALAHAYVWVHAQEPSLIINNLVFESWTKSLHKQNVSRTRAHTSTHTQKYVSLHSINPLSWSWKQSLHTHSHAHSHAHKHASTYKHLCTYTPKKHTQMHIPKELFHTHTHTRSTRTCTHQMSTCTRTHPRSTRKCPYPDFQQSRLHDLEHNSRFMPVISTLHQRLPRPRPLHRWIFLPAPHNIHNMVEFSRFSSYFLLRSNIQSLRIVWPVPHNIHNMVEFSRFSCFHHLRSNIKS